MFSKKNYLKNKIKYSCKTTFFFPRKKLLNQIKLEYDAPSWKKVLWKNPCFIIKRIIKCQKHAPHSKIFNFGNCTNTNTFNYKYNKIKFEIYIFSLLTSLCNC